MRIFSLLRRPKAVLTFRICIGGFFFLAGAAKLAQPAGLFANQISAFGILPGGGELPLAYLLPWIELFCGSLLLVGLFSRWAAIFIMAQLVIFAAAISVAVLSGAALEDCGCLPGVSETPAQALVRDLIMIAWLSLSFQGLPGKPSLDGWLESSGE